MTSWRISVAAWGLTVMAILSCPLATSATAQQPNTDGGSVPKAPVAPFNRGRLSPFTISNELNLGVEKLRRALDLQTNGTAPSPEETAKIIYEGYARVRSAHALLSRRMSHVTEKTKSPDPMLDLAFAIIRRARFRVLHARQATLRSNPARSIELLTAAIPELERASALIQ